MLAATRERLQQVKPVTPVWRSYGQKKRKSRNSDSRSVKLPLRSYSDPNPSRQPRKWFKNESFQINISDLIDAGKLPRIFHAKMHAPCARASPGILPARYVTSSSLNAVSQTRLPRQSQLPRTGGGRKGEWEKIDPVWTSPSADWSSKLFTIAITVLRSVSKATGP